MMDVTRGARGEVVIHVAGTLDPQAVSRLTGWLGEVPAGARVIVDFSGAKDLQDRGLAAIAGPLSGHVAIEVFGLSQHQRRLLRYLGVELDADDLVHADGAG